MKSDSLAKAKEATDRCIHAAEFTACRMCIATAIDEARLEEAKCGRNHCLTGMCNRERIAELEASLRESSLNGDGGGESVRRTWNAALNEAAREVRNNFIVGPKVLEERILKLRLSLRRERKK